MKTQKFKDKLKMRNKRNQKDIVKKRGEKLEGKQLKNKHANLY